MIRFTPIYYLETKEIEQHGSRTFDINIDRLTDSILRLQTPFRWIHDKLSPACYLETKETEQHGVMALDTKADILTNSILFS
jgi:hypothetical protein